MSASPAIAGEGRIGAADGPLNPIRLEVIRCADDDGSRRCDVTFADVEAMLAVANRIYAKAGMRFVCDAGADTVDINNTMMNSQDDSNVRASGVGTPDDIERQILQIAHKYPGKLPVFFRYGPTPRPVGNGYSGGAGNPIILPSLRHTNAGTRMLAHEAGHFFGLPHTFRERFHTIATAADFLASNGNSLAAFDGDNLADTAPDPCLDIPFNHPVQSVIINGLTVPLPYGNIMSYMNWDGFDWMSDQQATLARQYCAARQRAGMGLQSNTFAENPLQAESLDPIYSRGCAGHVQPMSGFGKGRWSGEAQLFCNAPIGGAVTLTFETQPGEMLDLGVYMTLAGDFGIVRFSLDGAPIGEPFDSYCPMVISSGRISLGKFSLTPGSHRLKGQITGQNPDSKGTRFGIDCLSLSEEKH